MNIWLHLLGYRRPYLLGFLGKRAYNRLPLYHHLSVFSQTLTHKLLVKSSSNTRQSSIHSYSLLTKKPTMPLDLLRLSFLRSLNSAIPVMKKTPITLPFKQHCKDTLLKQYSYSTKHFYKIKCN